MDVEIRAGDCGVALRLKRKKRINKRIATMDLKRS
jgi:hypothetical protein